MARRKPVALTSLQNAELPDSLSLTTDATDNDRAQWHRRMLDLVETMDGLGRLVVLRHEAEIDALYPVTIPGEV